MNINTQKWLKGYERNFFFSHKNETITHIKQKIQNKNTNKNHKTINSNNLILLFENIFYFCECLELILM